MFGNILESMLPPGVTMEMLSSKAQEIAAQMVKTAQTVELNNAMLREVIKRLDAGQGATLTATLKESNHDNEQPARIAHDPASDAPGTDIAGSRDSRSVAPGTGTAHIDAGNFNA